MTEHSLWSHLPLLVRSNSKDSVEFILQTLWKTRKTGLDPYDRETIRGVLQLSNDVELDPLLVCLRTLIRKCVHGNCKRDEVQNLFPPEVSPELRRLLTILLQKFQREWQEDARDDKVSLPRLKAMSWNMANQNDEHVDHAAIINLKLQDDTQSVSGEVNVNFQITKDTLETMLKSMYYIRDQLSNGEASSRQLQANGQQKDVRRLSMVPAMYNIGMIITIHLEWVKMITTVIRQYKSIFA